jgi:hypothetical protein
MIRRTIPSVTLQAPVRAATGVLPLSGLLLLIRL